jgi:hypothetical protein
MVQLDCFNILVKNKIINDNTIIALHDTNLHYSPYTLNNISWYKYIDIESENGIYASKSRKRNGNRLLVIQLIHLQCLYNSYP